MSGDLNMKSLGKIKFLILIATIILFYYGQPDSQEDEYYYTCSYEGNSFGTDILFSKIDLNSKEIIASASIPIGGELQFKNPIKLMRGIHEFYCILTLNGLPAKNTEISNEVDTEFAILNNRFELVLTGSIPEVQLLDFIHYPNSDIEIKFLRKQGQNWRNKKASLSLGGNNRINFSNELEDPWKDENYPVISGFHFFKKIKRGNNRLYWDVMPEGTYVLSLDIDNNVLLDSLNVETELNRFYLFGLSQNDTAIYVFFMNSNIIGGPETLRKANIDPSFVKIFDSVTFNQIDSIPIQYPPIDSGYVLGSTGSIDRVGDYFVFFDLNSEDYRYFSPAMLFIFDTRTNEATWLRVGWR
jgi:hypothetical protein